MQALTFASDSLDFVPASPLSRTKATATFDVRCSCQPSLQLGVIQHSGAFTYVWYNRRPTKWWLSSPLLASSSVQPDALGRDNVPDQPNYRKTAVSSPAQQQGK